MSTSAAKENTHVTKTLQDIFSICQMPVIHQFLLGSYGDGETLVSHDRPESLSAVLRVSAQEMMPVRYGRIFDHSHKVNFRSTPAINVGTIALGHCSVQYLDGDGRRHVHMRYARDDTSGKLLAVSVPMLDIVELELVTFHSARRRTRVNARFQAASFLRACEADRIEAAGNALHAISTSRELRQCPVCGRDGAVNLDDGSGDCCCRFPLAVATQAFDFQRDRANMAFQGGRFHGDCVLRLFQHGAVSIEARLVTEMWSKSTTDITRLMGQQGTGSSGLEVMTSSGVAPAQFARWTASSQASSAVERGMEAMLYACSQAQTKAASPSQTPSQSRSQSHDGSGGAAAATLLLDERARKIELRKERNRLAAARSNAKRKERTDQLRDALRDAVEREQMLREREGELRRENVQLRLLLGRHRSDVAERLAHVVNLPPRR